MKIMVKVFSLLSRSPNSNKNNFRLIVLRKGTKICTLERQDKSNQKLQFEHCSA